MIRGILFFVVASILMTGCSNEDQKVDKSNNPRKKEQQVSKPLVKAEIIADKLQVPWAINKHNQVFYISERTGTIVKIENGQTERQQVQLSKPLATSPEAGLLGFVLAPDFAASKKAFAYYTYTNSSGQFNRVIMLELTNNKWSEKQILLDKIPSGQFHHGGRMKIGPDQKLYVTTGDATQQDNAQNLASLGGKILRMELDGSIPSDNPFSQSYVYSYGHRNPQGLAWDANGTLFESEHGPSAHDEINIIKAGANYGWPLVIGAETMKGMETPLFQSGDDTWAPSGMDYYHEKLYVATLRGNAIREFDLHTKKTRIVVSGYGRIRDVWINDGVLYFVSNNTDGRGNPDSRDDKLYQIGLKNL